MDGALRGAVAPASRGSDQFEPRAEGQIVIVRPQVVENVGHVLGNLFQRIYHSIGQVGESAPLAAAQLDSSTRQLEDFLQLVIDYFSPLPLALQYVPTTEVVQSLARQISDAVGGSVKIDARLPTDGRLLVDAGRLARAFALLAKQLVAAGADARNGIAVQAAERPPGQSLSIGLVVPPDLLAARSSTSEVEWAVAEKFLEVHGGALYEKPTPSGETLWQIVLPLQP